MDGQTTTSNIQSQSILLKRKVVSTAGSLHILGIQFPASTLTITDLAISLVGPIYSSTIPFDQIEKVEIKPFFEWALFQLYKPRLYGKGIKIWRKGAPESLSVIVKNKSYKDLLDPNLFMAIIIKPELILDILKVKRPDLFPSQTDANSAVNNRILNQNSSVTNQQIIKEA